MMTFEIPPNLLASCDCLFITAGILEFSVFSPKCWNFDNIFKILKTRRLFGWHNISKSCQNPLKILIFDPYCHIEVC